MDKNKENFKKKGIQYLNAQEIKELKESSKGNNKTLDAYMKEILALNEKIRKIEARIQIYFVLISFTILIIQIINIFI